MRTIISVFIMTLTLGKLTLGTLSSAEELLRINVFPLPGQIESAESGPFIEVLKAIEACLPRPYIAKNEIYPPKRAVANLLGKAPSADANFPAINIPSNKENGIAYSKQAYGKVSFVIYSNIKKPITRSQLLMPNSSISVETFPAIAASLPFKANAFSCLECSLKKVAAGRLDATLMAMDETDEMIRKEKFRTIHRSFYENFDGVFTVADSPRGQEVAKILDAAVLCAIKDPNFSKIYDRVHKPYFENKTK